ncbi:MAG: ATP-dependent Clp protease proteolytic subunit [Planctomycetes bacterium]|nr:ATP-dependent Clp protease proteolytic subunit [Planctomycetota bacterium]
MAALPDDASPEEWNDAVALPRCVEPEKPEKKKTPVPPSLRLLLQQRVVMIAKPVDRTLMEKVSSALLLLDGRNKERPITVFVNSPGGDADSGFAIYDVMKYVRAPIRTICAGLAASAGVPIFLGGRKGMRFSLPSSRFLIHQPSMQAMGSASDIEITSVEIERIREKYNRIIELETGRSAEKVKSDCMRDFWLDAKEAVQYGLVDRIVTGANEID